MPIAEERNARAFRSGFTSFEEALRWALNLRDTEYRNMDSVQLIVESTKDAKGDVVHTASVAGGKYDSEEAANVG